MTAAPRVVSVRCSWCSKQRPEFRVHRLTSGQALCDYCLEWHLAALEVLSGGVPAGCQQCGADWARLRAAAPGVEVRMYVVPKDGIYQLLCACCVRPYVGKRADLYAGTRFGKETLKL
jgi:hypothetical protein